MEIIKRIDKSILKCIKYYRKNNSKIAMESAKNLLRKKHAILSGTEYEIKDITMDCIMAFGGCMPFHYLPGIKNPIKLLQRINNGLDKLPNLILKYKKQKDICDKCPLNGYDECFNCWHNKEIIKLFAKNFLSYFESED